MKSTGPLKCAIAGFLCTPKWKTTIKSKSIVYLSDGLWGALPGAWGPHKFVMKLVESFNLVRMASGMARKMLKVKVFFLPSTLYGLPLPLLPPSPALLLIRLPPPPPPPYPSLPHPRLGFI